MKILIRHAAALAAAAALLGCSTPKQDAATFDPASLSRRYQEGEVVVYRMKASNQSRLRTIRYEAEAQGKVQKNAMGQYVEEFAWTNYVLNGAPVTLSPEAAAFRQRLSLEKGFPLTVPDLRPVLRLVGPITDLLTFYVDLAVAKERGSLRRVGDHFHVAHGAPATWADGHYILKGEDSIDFDVALEALDADQQVATLVVRHVVPVQPQISFVADWMRNPVADTPNNWMQVSKQQDGRYIGAVGKELFDARVRIDLRNGRILGATLHNPVEIIERICTDAELTHCDAPIRSQILRQIEIASP